MRSRVACCRRGLPGLLLKNVTMKCCVESLFPEDEKPGVPGQAILGSWSSSFSSPDSITRANQPLTNHKIMPVDFVYTIEDDDENVPMLDDMEEEISEQPQEQKEQKKDSKKVEYHGIFGSVPLMIRSRSQKSSVTTVTTAKDTIMNPTFSFSMEGISLQDIKNSTIYKKGARAVWDFDNVKQMMAKKNVRADPWL